MTLTPQEESLIQAVRALPAVEAERMLAWARQLADLSSSQPFEWSDSWSDEDLIDVREAILRTADQRESGSH